jgi:uncharacterized membrane protein YhaH (DUF805 family)
MSDVWYFADQGGQQGPVNRQDLMAALSRMPNAPDVFVWQPGFSDWKRAGDVAELNVRGSGAPPLPPMRDGAPAYRGTPMPDESNTGVARLWFGFSGRANRAKYWLVAAINVAIMTVLTVVAIVGNAPALWIVFIIAILVLVVSSVAVSIRRLHDRGKSGWWVLVFIFVPGLLNGVGSRLDDPVPMMILSLAGLAISIWALVELGFLRGTQGDNAYGPDPLRGA